MEYWNIASHLLHFEINKIILQYANIDMPSAINKYALGILSISFKWAYTCHQIRRSLCIQVNTIHVITFILLFILYSNYIAIYTIFKLNCIQVNHHQIQGTRYI